MGKPVSKQEIVTVGTVRIGTVNQTDRGFEAFGPFDQYVATFPTLSSARKALFDMHMAAKGEDA
ncbi:hypothetical protein [Pelagibacterium sp.]|uniref:hypothetical protein n=1 Tax=Pelagibacterium sp. TaxID=1967288 RepID=UPI003BAB8D42